MVTPKIHVRRPVPKVTLFSSEIVEMGHIETHFFRHSSKKSALKYEKLQSINESTENQEINLLWKCAWLLKPESPLWNGFMQMVNKGSHPGQSSVIFMPMIDMK